MALLFNSSTPQSIKDKKLYDDESTFTNDDLQDVLDGLLKLRVSSNTKRALPRMTPKIMRNNADNHCTNSSSPNRHNAKYQTPPRFIANSRSLRRAQNGINLLFEAAKRVEGRSNFLMDIDDINRITNPTRFEDIKDQIIYNEETGVMKKKSKNGISPPQKQPKSKPKKPKPKQEEEDRRISREWSNRNIEEMDQMYDDKSKLAQLKDNKQMRTASAAKMDHLTNSCAFICKEFSESNRELHCVINEHKDNMDKIRSYHRKYSEERDKQNEILKRQLAIMEDKITKQRQKEEAMAKRRLQKEEKQQIAQAQAQAQAHAQAKAQAQAQAQAQAKAQATAQATAQAVKKQNTKAIRDEKKEWYSSEEALCATYAHYKVLYKQCEEKVVQMEQNGTDLEMRMGLILPAIRANQKSVFDAFKRLQRIVNERTKPNSMERQYCFIKITKLIICDVSIIKSSAQKFASAYFLSFIMNEYQSEYLPIFKCMFYGHCLWTLPYIDKQLRNFNPNTPSIVRCVVLQYRNIKDIKDVPSEKVQYLQKFTKDNNAGTVVFEAEKTYFDRMQGICGLFAAFMSIRNNNAFCNPFGIDSSDCWKWIAHLLCLPPCVYPELCSILSSIIQIIGHDMLRKYPKQFPKIISFIYCNVFLKCDESTTTRSKARRELNLFLRECQASMKRNNGTIVIKKPTDSKLIAKTVGASALTNIGGNRKR